MPSMGLQCVFIAFSNDVDQILVAFGCIWFLRSMNLSDCLFLHWTLVGSLVLLVEAVHFSSARRAGGPSQPLLNQI